MTLKETIKLAVESRNLGLIDRIVEKCRYKDRMGYLDIALLFHRCAGISADEFEALMYESDEFASENA